MENHHNEQVLANALRDILPRFASVSAGEARHLHSANDDPWWERHDCIRSLSVGVCLDAIAKGEPMLDEGEAQPNA